MNERERNDNYPQRRRAELHRGRVSAPGCTYFVTTVTKDRVSVLRSETYAQRVIAAWQTLHTSGDWEILAATVMPDHVHLLFTLGTRLPLCAVVSKFKNLARGGNSTPWRWQDDVFEHRLRDHETTERYGRYIFMNPYVAKLLGVNGRWPWWSCPNPRRFWFCDGLNEHGGPLKEWFADPEDETKPLHTGD